MKCDYGKCQKEATTKGVVFTREMKPVEVHACDTHKKKISFFEDYQKNA